jgi:hypothetical protein
VLRRKHVQCQLEAKFSEIMPGQKKIRGKQRPVVHKWDLQKLASCGGKARARKLSKRKLRAISRLGGLAARGVPRKKYKRKPKKPKRKRGK